MKESQIFLKLLGAGAVFVALSAPVHADPVGSGLNLAFTSVGAESSYDDGRKAIAQAVIEDAANYYSSGEMTGLLPAAVKHVRETDPKLARASDAEIIDAMVSRAQAELK